MKGIICFFSNTGNTRLVCEYIRSQVHNMVFDLWSITREEMPDFNQYEFIGFATYTDFWGPPKKLQDFFERIPKQDGEKPAFVLNTHAGESGKTPMILKDWAKSKGFLVLHAHSLITPANYPPALASGWSNGDDPDEASVKAFDEFILRLDRSASDLSAGIKGKEADVLPEEKDMAFPFAVRTVARDEMGRLFVDSSLCTRCGLCESVCSYHAVQLYAEPEFDMQKCYGCWACFNKCPSLAIHTGNIRGKGHYPGPSGKFAAKFALE